jgi:hypothetical protein
MELECFDEVDELVKHAGEAVPFLCCFSKFHPSEVPIRRLQSFFATGQKIDRSFIEMASNCLGRLADDSRSGDDTGLKYLLRGCDVIELSLPKATTVGNMLEILSIIRSTLNSVENVSPSTPVALAKKIDSLQDRIEAFKFVQTTVGDCNCDDYREVRSPNHLFEVLLKQGLFTFAEKLWTSDLRHKLSRDGMVHSFLKVQASTHPRQYAALLEKVVLPRLSTGHRLLRQVIAWTFRTADALDSILEDHCGLEGSILLLEVSLEILYFILISPSTPVSQIPDYLCS